MYEEVNVSALIRQILTNFLMSMANGLSIDSFLTSNDEVNRLLREFQNLRESNESLLEVNESLNQTNLSLQEQIENATLIMDAQEVAMARNNNSEAISLLLNAIDILGGVQGGNVLVTEDTVEEETATPAVEEITEEVVEEVLAPVDDAHEDDDIDEIFGTTSTTPYEETTEEPVGQEPDYDGIDDEDFEFDDEDLEQEAQETSAEITIVKNPEITDNFVSIEDSYMRIFICVRYSHLPYHYTVDGVRYKFVVEGSQTVAVRV